ncbi:MAG: hypothetical protein ACI9F9_000880 [Candidatus Paceibacteria bacterium]|jgi:hypothetical protein
MHLLAPILLSLASVAFGLEDKPDLIVLKTGKEIECRVMRESETSVFYKSGRKVKELELDKVEGVHSIERSMRLFLERYSELDSRNVVALTELALWAENEALAGEARNLWIRILLLDNENEQAWTKLGGSHSKRGWRLRVRGRYYNLEDLRGRVGEWKNALELPTAHFLVKTNIDPLRALDVSIDVERLYMMYYDLIGKPMELYPFEQVPELHIYGDADDAPRPPQPHWTAWFERIGNAVLVRGQEAQPHEVRKAVIDLMLTNSFRMALGNNQGALPQWAREGIGNAFAIAMRPEAGNLGVETGVPYLPWFESHAADEKPVSLKKVLDAGRGAFNTGGDESRFVAQSYTLVFFLLRGAEGKYRETFIAYLRSAFDGKGAASHFKKIFDLKLEDLDQEWSAFVKQTAGA